MQPQLPPDQVTVVAPPQPNATKLPQAFYSTASPYQTQSSTAVGAPEAISIGTALIPKEFKDSLRSSAISGAKKLFGLGDTASKATNAFQSAVPQAVQVSKLGPIGSGSLGISSGGGLSSSAQAAQAAAQADVTGFGGIGGAQTGATASMSSILGAAGLGFAGGGLLANLTGGNELGGSIGGGIGAGAGMAFAPLLGVTGPIGALAGGVLGALGGSLFGNNQPTNASAGQGMNPFTGEILSKGNKTSANIENRDQLGNRITSSVDRLQTILGVDDSLFQDKDYLRKNNMLLGIDVGSRDGIQYHYFGDIKKVGVGQFEEAEANIVKDLARQVANREQFGVEKSLIDRINSSQATTVEDFLDEIEGINKKQGAAGQGLGIEQTAADTAFEQFLADYQKNN